jgi:hypothetical protein
MTSSISGEEISQPTPLRMGDLPGTSMDVSVVISTYNRCSLLARALESLQHQETSGVS